MPNWDIIAECLRKWEALPFSTKLDIVKAVVEASLYDPMRAEGEWMWKQGQKDAAQLYTENAHLCQKCKGSCCGGRHFSVLDAYIALRCYPGLELPAPHTTEWAEKHGACVWLEPGKGCLLPRNARPVECASYICATWEDAWLKFYKDGQKYRHLYLITLAEKAYGNLTRGAFLVQTWLDNNLETVLKRAYLTSEGRELFRIAFRYGGFLGG